MRRAVNLGQAAAFSSINSVKCAGSRRSATPSASQPPRRRRASPALPVAGAEPLAWEVQYTSSVRTVVSWETLLNMGTFMEKFTFSEADRRQMRSLGISEAQALSQMEMHEKSSFRLRLASPCTLKSGVQKIAHESTKRYLRFHSEAARLGRFRKFVPASGAATRMFESLLGIYHMPPEDPLGLRAENGASRASDLLKFMHDIRRFPFFEDLDAVLARDGFSLTGLISTGRPRKALQYLLSDRGLDYGALPKALLKFHRRPSGSRTAFEEHLVEGIDYLSDGKYSCALHFTISPEHEKRFLHLLDAVKHGYAERYGTDFDVAFSFQNPSTNTIAAGAGNVPFRDAHGRLHFRPGGHGALLDNLNDLKGDLIYIKNVDNLCQDHLKDTGVFWKRVLGGYLVEVQRRVHSHIRKLLDRSSVSLRPTEELLKNTLMIELPAGYGYWSMEKKRVFLLSRLNRPIRVCGVVPNEGEPGGAPFWVEDKSGGVSVQIVEQAQVDLDSLEQRDIWRSSTHFNSVDLVCAVRDYQGKPFDLKRYVDPDAVFLTKKSRDGRELQALELPGLWNGSMADWISIMVEVPSTTFSPVKTVFDLLRPEHQPEELMERGRTTGRIAGNGGRREEMRSIA